MNNLLSNLLHIETTTRCTLACPACPRTTWHSITKRPVIKSDLNVDHLEKFLDCESGQQIRTFYLCGDYGDSIYYPDLFKLIDRFRKQVNFQIVTNGSRQSVSFWKKLAGALTENDSVIFSIDGLENTNHLYRINSDWASLMQGLDIMSQSDVKVHWKTIVFKFNYDKLDEIKTFAESKGATFHAEKTHRYGDQSLEPPEEYVETNHLFRNEFATNSQIEIEPRCEKDATTITADGYLFPCDWIRNPRTLYKSQLWKQKDRWLEKLKIETTTYDQALLVVRDWENYVKQNSLTNPEKVDVLCKMLCRKGCVSDNTIKILSK
jgi:MoaA/NifB/PqqE/SkfB family radical SAM enzyme